MPDGFWKTLGSNLVDAGVAYLQQVRVVNELKHLSLEEARLRFMQYVQGLSSTARAGLTVTLATLANSERDTHAKRLIELLRADLVNPQQQAIASAPLDLPTTAGRPSFEEDLNRVIAWCELEDENRHEAIGAYLDALGLDGLANLHANLGQMQTNCTTNIKNHHDNEARIAAGRFIEDQMHYRALILAGGPRNPDWLRQLQDLEGWERWFSTLGEVVEKFLEERRRPPAPSPSPPATSNRCGSLPEIEAMRSFLEEGLTTGKVRSERAVMSRRVLDKLEGVLLANTRGEIAPEDVQSRVKQLYADFADAIADPGAKGRVAAGNPRLKKIDTYAGKIKVALMKNLMPPPPEATAKAIGAMLGDLTKFQDEVAKASDDVIAHLESELLRRTARARHELEMTRHALIAKPLWKSVDYLPAINAIVYSGGEDLRRKLEAAVKPHRLTVSSTRQLKNYGQERWNELNTCHVACFDLRGASEIAELATKKPQRARALAEAAYELGLAFALGKPVIVACTVGETMPFDVDLTPVELEGDESDMDRLVLAVDEAFYVLQRNSCGSSIQQSIVFLDNLTSNHPKRRAFEGMGWLNPTLANDPTGFAARAEQLLRELSASSFRLLRPAWPAAYPDTVNRCCFHVMPFRPSWANAVRDTARQACKKQHIMYQRGDESKEGQIIHAIWGELCRASIVLVDLTDPNPNIFIELGMAHAIGRPILAVRQHDAIDVGPKHIKKLRVLPYESPASLKDLLLGEQGFRAFH